MALKVPDCRAIITSPPSSIDYSKWTLHKCRECFNGWIDPLAGKGKCPKCRGTGIMDQWTMMKLGLTHEDK